MRKWESKVHAGLVLIGLSSMGSAQILSYTNSWSAQVISGGGHNVSANGDFGYFKDYYYYSDRSDGHDDYASEVQSNIYLIYSSPTYLEVDGWYRQNLSVSPPDGNGSSSELAQAMDFLSFTLGSTETVTFQVFNSGWTDTPGNTADVSLPGPLGNFSVPENGPSTFTEIESAGSYHFNVSYKGFAQSGVDPANDQYVAWAIQIGTPVATPEPSTIAIMSCGVLLFLRRRSLKL